jgi:4a-hydroxytetrahydrobiopterin dehydratase
MANSLTLTSLRVQYVQIDAGHWPEPGYIAGCTAIGGTIMTLSEKQCVPCQGGIAPMGEAQAQAFVQQLPDWALEDSATRIARNFSFDDFVAAQTFVNKVGDLAETEGHHPDISFGWGYARITIHTHKIKGLHENDFILAAKIDELT